MGFRNCRATGLFPRVVDFKSDADFKNEELTLAKIKKGLEKRLANLPDKDDRIQAILEAFAGALPHFGKEKALRVFAEFMLAEIPEPIDMNFVCVKCENSRYDSWGKPWPSRNNGMTWKYWNPEDEEYPVYEKDNQKYYCV